MTLFPATPADVARLTVDEFVCGLEVSSAPLDAICRRFGDDTNRALVWVMRQRALQTFMAHLEPGCLDETRETAQQLAAVFTLNDDWEFDRAPFLAAIERTRGVQQYGR